jgi:hypothetical protein
LEVRNYQLTGYSTYLHRKASPNDVRRDPHAAEISGRLPTRGLRGGWVSEVMEDHSMLYMVYSLAFKVSVLWRMVFDTGFISDGE